MKINDITQYTIHERKKALKETYRICSIVQIEMSGETVDVKGRIYDYCEHKRERKGGGKRREEINMLVTTGRQKRL